MKVGILQQNYVVGDCVGNGRKIMMGYRRLVAKGAELVITSELGILGYPPKDLLNKEFVVNRQLEVFRDICERIGDVPIVLGVAEWNESTGKPLFNNGVVVWNAKIIARGSKQLLPTYDVFDETRYFKRGRRQPCVFDHHGKRIALLICEDVWGGTENPRGQRLYANDPVQDLVGVDPDMLVIINASPYFWGKGDVRFGLVADIAKRIGCPVVSGYQVGGNDDLIFDGRSFAVNERGDCIAAARPFVEEELLFDTEGAGSVDYPHDTDRDSELYDTLVLGTRDYLAKTGYTKAVIAESGGIDSALVTSIAADAIGAENVTAIGMPSPFSSSGSVNDARNLCRNLGVDFRVVSIGPLYDVFGGSVNELIGWHGAEAFGADVTEENVQARLRAAIIMAYSNRNNAIVLSTGNKSELAVGYCTLYGDMVGGLAVISDVYKTTVYRQARYVNSRGKIIIPTEIIDKPPSAELRPGQKDQDSLPSYDVLDGILYLYVDEEQDPAQIIRAGFDPNVVAWVTGKVDRAEYKRRQGALGLKATSKAFGFGRRYPIATKPRV